jgi:hypothetical protein
MALPPSRGSVSSPFGMRVNPNDGKYRMHYGEDTLGAGNYAPVNGRVVFAGWDYSGTGLGWTVGIRETAAPAVIWWIGHHGASVKVNPLTVAVGNTVWEGVTYLGPKGSTGAAKGPHAHTERRVGGAVIPGSGTATNPRDYYSAGGGLSGGGVVVPEPVIEDFQEEGADMIVLLKQSTAAEAATGGGVFCLYNPSAVDPSARWQEFSEYSFARALVDALHSRRKDAAEASAVVLPDYAWDVWKKRAIGSSAPVTVSLPDDIARKGDIPTAEQNGQAARDAIVKPQ